MHVLPILFADDEDIWVFVRLAIIALFVIGPVILKALGGSARQADRTTPKRKKSQPSGDQMPSDHSSTDAEIEDFLRRAEAKRRGGPAQQAQPVRPRPQPQRQPVRNPYLVSADEVEIVDAQVVPQPVAPEGELESRFESSISTSDFEQRAQRLGDRVEHADDAMESRLHAVFDHGLGDLSQVSAEVATADVTPAPEDAASTVGRTQVAAASAASRIAHRLRSPEGMRDAIVLREILEPPQHRW